MSWSKLSINTPGSIPEINQHINVLTVSPWTHGVKEGKGNHTSLPFPNAVQALSDLIDISKAVFAIAISASDLRGFEQQAAALNSLLELKEFERLQRHAKTLLTLEQDKFDLVDATETQKAISLNTIPALAELTKYKLEITSKNEAAELVNSDPLANLAAFESSFPDESQTPSFSGGAGWCFYADSDIKNSLKVNQQGAGYKYTAIVVFMGTANDLAYLREVMP